MSKIAKNRRRFSVYIAGAVLITFGLCGEVLARSKVDWKAVLEAVTQGVSEGLQSGAPKETINYENDEKLAKDLSASLSARLTRVRVNVKGFDTEEMVPGVLVFSRAIKATKGKIIYCKVNEQESVGGFIWPLVLPYVLSAAKDYIGSEIRKGQIPSLVKSYYLFVYVRDDGRTTEYLLFRKRSLGNTCEKYKEEKPEKMDK